MDRFVSRLMRFVVAVMVNVAVGSVLLRRYLTVRPEVKRYQMFLERDMTDVEVYEAAARAAAARRREPRRPPWRRPGRP